MKFAPIIPLPASDELAAIIAPAVPGSAFSLPLADGRVALLTLAAFRPGKEGGVGAGMSPFGAAAYSVRAARFDNEQFQKMTARILTGQARSPHQAAIQLVAEGEYRGNGGTPENQAHRLGKLYRKSLCLPASSFQKKTKKPNANPNTASDLSVTIDCINKQIEGKGMADKKESVLASGVLEKIIPRHWLIDLRNEGLGDATYDEILSPDFWIEAKDAVRLGDIITLLRADGSTLDVLALTYPNGDIIVKDLAVLGLPVPRHPDLPAAEKTA